MIEIANIESSPIVELRVDGKLTKDDIQEIDAFFESKVSEHDPVNILLQLENWDGLTLKGFIEDFKLMTHLKRKNKIAVVADTKLFKADARMEDMLPGINVQHFEPNEMTSAKRWLKETDLDNKNIDEHLYE